jgi:putative ABC transport system permease protein
MPDFPGIEKAESTRDWDPTLPISMDKIRPQDETYWQEHRGTPKAFLPLATGQSIWTNRFGELTAIRFPVAGPEIDATREQLASRLRDALAPEQFGLRFEPVREQALASALNSQDFGGLFLGFSLFLIVAALLLVALLFQFGVERRGEEIGTLLAWGSGRAKCVGSCLAKRWGWRCWAAWPAWPRARSMPGP